MGLGKGAEDDFGAKSDPTEASFSVFWDTFRTMNAQKAIRRKHLYSRCRIGIGRSRWQPNSMKVGIAKRLKK